MIQIPQTEGRATGTMNWLFDCHIHLITRNKGDVPNPKGGVRGVIPSQQKY